MAPPLPGPRHAVAAAALAAALLAAPAARASRGDPPPSLVDVEPPPPAASPGAPSPPPGPPPLTAPTDGAVTGRDRPRIEARLAAPVDPDRIALAVDGADVTGMARVIGASIAYEPPRPLAPGPHQVRLVVDGVTTAWSFTVQPGSPPAAAAGGPKAEWIVNAQGMLTHAAGSGSPDDTTARLLVNSRADVQGEHWYARETTDLAVRQGLQGTSGLALESRDYAGVLGVRGGGYGAELQAGYFTPDFLDGSRLLAIGIPGGGVEARATAPGFTAGVYQNYDSRPAGVVAGVAGPSESLRAAGAEADLGDRLALRAMALQATDQPGLYTAGGNGTAVGLLGRALLGPAATVLLELAHGAYTPNPGGPDGARSGLALRLGLLGGLDGWSWTLDLRRTDDGYVNPANRGFASGALTDRTGGDALVSKQLGPVSIGASARHIEGGTSATGSLPSAREDGGTVFATAAVGPAVTLSASGQATATKAGADPAHYLPATDALATGGTLSATELWRRVQFLESYSYQSSHDAETAADTRVQTGQLGASGPITDTFTLGVTGSASVSDLPGGAGQATTLNAALAPTVLLPALWITVQPQVSLSSSRAAGATSRAVDAQGQVTWSPPWLRSLFAVQLSGDWTRTDAPIPASQADVYRVIASLLLNWSLGSARGGPAPAAPPVTPAAAVPPGLGPAPSPVAGAAPGLPPPPGTPGYGYGTGTIPPARSR